VKRPYDAAYNTLELAAEDRQIENRLEYDNMPTRLEDAKQIQDRIKSSKQVQQLAWKKGAKASREQSLDVQDEPTGDLDGYPAGKLDDHVFEVKVNKGLAKKDVFFDKIRRRQRHLLDVDKADPNKRATQFMATLQDEK